MPAMPKELPLYVTRERTRHGKWVWHYRIGGRGKRIRIRGEFGTAEWRQSYNNAVNGAGQEPSIVLPPTGSFAARITEYRKSNAFLSLGTSTQSSRGAIFDRIVEKSRKANIGSVTSLVITETMDARTPNSANNFLRAIKHFFKWAHAREYVSVNPAANISKLPVKTDGHHTWTDDEVRQFRNHHDVGAMARLAFEVLYHTGLRISDAVDFGPHQLINNIYEVRTKKTGRIAYIPRPRELTAIAMQTPAANTAVLRVDCPPYIRSKYNRAFTAKSFPARFRSWCDEAKIAKRCSSHGLRKKRAVIKAEGGATAHDLMSFFAWDSLSEAERYTREADRRRIAINSVREQ